MEEKYFDYENYIQKRLKEIDDLDERRYAKELLLDSLKKVFTWTESRYGDLERRIQEELDVPWKHFYICTTIVERGNYDPINSYWHPVCEEDIRQESNGLLQTVYLAAEEELCREFLEKGVENGCVEGITEKTGNKIRLRIKRAARYEAQMKKLHVLFSANSIPWQTVHMGHLERFFDLVPEEGEKISEGESVRILWGKWGSYVREGFIPLWNIQRMDVHPQEFRHPCVDDVIYEHICYLGKEITDGDGYLAQAEGNVLSVRCEKNKVIIKTDRDSLGSAFLYRFHQRDDGSSYGYKFPILSNEKKENWAARYLQRAGNFIQTPLELRRKVEELSGNYIIRLSSYEIRQMAGADRGDLGEGEMLEGDMDGYYGTKVFPQDKRSILLFRFLRESGGKKEEYLYQSQIRYILSQLQMEFLEYRCVGIVEWVKEGDMV